MALKPGLPVQLRPASPGGKAAALGRSDTAYARFAPHTRTRSLCSAHVRRTLALFRSRTCSLSSTHTRHERKRVHAVRVRNKASALHTTSKPAPLTFAGRRA
jgi:hypothetical protein